MVSSAWYTCTFDYNHSEEAGVLWPWCYDPVSRVSKEASQDNKPVTILAFYPFPLFLVRDHFSIIGLPRLKTGCIYIAANLVKFKLLSFYLTTKHQNLPLLKLITCCVKAIHLSQLVIGLNSIKLVRVVQML